MLSFMLSGKHIQERPITMIVSTNTFILSFSYNIHFYHVTFKKRKICEEMKTPCLDNEEKKRKENKGMTLQQIDNLPTKNSVGNIKNFVGN